MKKMLVTAVLYTVVTGAVLGVVYPLVVTAVARVLFPQKAHGQLIVRDGAVTGSALLGQSFSGPRYFHGRPSAAGVGYDAGASGGSNLGPSSKALVDRVAQSVQTERREGDVPVDLVTASASGLDPEISPAAAAYQIAGVAQARGLTTTVVQGLVSEHTRPRQFGVLGEPGVNVLQLNLALDAMK